MNKDEIHLMRHCGICGRLFGFLDRCVALMGTPDSSTCRDTTPPFRYPMMDDPVRVEGQCLCRRGYCYGIKLSPESVTLHHDCFEVVRNTYSGADCLDRLWTFALYRKPWRDAARLFVRQRPVVCSQGVTTVARRLGIPELVEKLPVELACLIHEYSESATFWQLAAAVDLAAKFSATEAAGIITSHALRRVTSWNRGEKPVVSRVPRDLPIIRITIDALGINKVERLLQHEPPYSKARSDELAFVIEHQADIGPGRVAILFKNGHARLELPKGNPGFRIWDTPTLPALPRPPPADYKALWSISESLWGPLKSEWSVFGRPPTHKTRFRTVDLSCITGLTFFYSDRDYYLNGIHVHTQVAPFSVLPPESMLWRGEQLWVYVPVSPGDQVTALSVMKSGHPLAVGGLLVRTRLGGTIPIGPIGLEARNMDYTVLSSRPATLIHNADDTNGVSFIGAYPRPASHESISEVLRYRISQTVPTDGYWGHSYARMNIHFATAPLSEVVLAEVFQRGRDPYCRGMVLTYKNGAQRALGDCRLGVDRTQRYRNPSFLCAALTTEPRTRDHWNFRFVCVEFHGEGTHEHQEAGWECHKTEGTLNFWFMSKQQYLEVVPAQVGRKAH